MRIAVATIDVLAVAAAAAACAVTWASPSPAEPPPVFACPAPPPVAPPPVAPPEPSPPSGTWSNGSMTREVHVDRTWSDTVVAECPGCPETMVEIIAEVRSAARPTPVRLVAVDRVTGERLADASCMEDWMPDWPKDRCTLRANAFGWPGGAPHAIDVRVESDVAVDVTLSALVLFPGD